MGALTPNPLAQKILAFAVEEATKLDHPYIGTEHLLLALLRDRDGGADVVLKALEVRRDDVRQMVMGIVQPGDTTTPPWTGSRPHTSRARKVLELADAAAVALGQAVLGTEHLLLGLTAERHGIGAQVLLQHGVSHERVHEVALHHLKGGAAAPPTPPGSTE